MVLIPEGPFQMGDAFGEYGFELPVRTVSLSAFYMDRYEVTIRFWDEVYEWAINHGYYFRCRGSGKAGDHPVYGITWCDALRWCNARSQRKGRTPAYYLDTNHTVVFKTYEGFGLGEAAAGEWGYRNDCVKWDSGYRLPTEAEWEKAARGGTEGLRFPWGSTITHSRANYRSGWVDGKPVYPYDISPTEGLNPNYDEGGEPYTCPAGVLAWNGYGLYGMAGNVWEWCWDGEGGYSDTPHDNPWGVEWAPYVIYRGGSFSSSARDCRVSTREDVGRQQPGGDIGFRCVLPQ